MIITVQNILARISLILLLPIAMNTTTILGPLGPMTTTAYIPFTLITTVPNPVVLGSIEHITITVSMNGLNGTRIPGATIHGMVIPPPEPPSISANTEHTISANTEHTFSGLTDSSGNLFYQMIISKYARPGQYMLNVQAIAPNNTRDNTPLEISTQNFTVAT